MEEKKANVEVPEEKEVDTTENDVIHPEEEYTPEQLEAKEHMEKKQKENEKKELEKAKKVYTLFQNGAQFLRFIQEDIEKQKKQHLNRPQRRRFGREIKKGMFSRELIEVYTNKVDTALEWIEQNLNNPEQTRNKIATHYHTQGFENPEFLKEILQDFFKGQFLMPGEKEEGEEVSEEEFEKIKKDQENKEESPEQKEEK